VLLFGLVLGMVALIWQRPPWAANSPGLDNDIKPSHTESG
jgi:hypothetical protein